MRLLSALSLVGVLLLCASGSTTRASGQERADAASSRPVPEERLRAAPAFTLPDLKGRQNKSTDLQENVVLLDFWATWCEPCIGEIPSLNHLDGKYKTHGVKVIGLAVQSGWPKDIKRFVDRYRMRFAVLVGTDDTVSDFDVISFPTTFLIAPGWRIYKKYVGTYEGKADEIERDVDALLARKQ